MKAMKAIVLSHENSGTYVLDRDGCFRFVQGHSAKPIGTEIDVSQQPPISITRIMSAAACFILVAFVGIFTWLWNITDYYVYVDINPSVEMRFNGLGKLRNAAALNSDATQLLSDLSLRGKADEAVVSLIDAARQKDFLKDASGGPNVLVTVVSARGRSPDTLIASINTALRERGMSEYTVVEAGSVAFRDKAADLGVSPGRLQLAEELLRGAGANMTLDEILQIPLGELFAAVNGTESTGKTAVIEGRIADDGPAGAQSPGSVDNNNNDNPGGSGAAGNGEGDALPDDQPADDPTADDANAASPANPRARASEPQSDDPPSADAVINTPDTPGASFTEPPATDPPPTEPPATDPPPTGSPPTEPPPTNPPGTGPRYSGPRDRNPPGDNGGSDGDDGNGGDGGDTGGDGGDSSINEPPDDDEPKEPPGDDTHPDDCGCEICVGESGEGFGAKVYALVTAGATGSTRIITITLIDAYGSYTQEFLYSNGTAEYTYTIKGDRCDYWVYVGFSGNAVEVVFITGYETKEGEVFGATVTADVVVNAGNRSVVITVTDEDGEHSLSFGYVNGTKNGVYTIGGVGYTYTVYVIYQGNDVHLAMIIDCVDLSPVNGGDGGGNGQHSQTNPE